VSAIDLTELIGKARVLHEALPYIQDFRGSIFVVKYGGSFMDDPDPTMRQAEGINMVEFSRRTVLKAAGLVCVAVLPQSRVAAAPQSADTQPVAYLFSGIAEEAAFVEGRRVTADRGERSPEGSAGVKGSWYPWLGVPGRQGPLDRGARPHPSAGELLVDVSWDRRP